MRSGGCGWESSVSRERPVTPDTVFHLFSATKHYTATALMVLVERGLVDSDNPVSDYLDETAWRLDCSLVGVANRCYGGRVPPTQAVGRLIVSDVGAPAGPVDSRPLGSIGLSILWAVLTLGIYTFFWTYRTYDEQERYRGEGLGGALGLVIYLVSAFIGLVAIAITGVLIWREIEGLYKDDGRESPHSPLWGLWLLLPLVGLFVWFIPTQRALNDFWQSKGAPAP